MRVLQITDSLGVGCGDTIVVMNYYKNLPKECNISFEFLYFIEKEHTYIPFLESQGAKVWHIPKLKYNNIISFINNLKKFFKINANRYDIVHLHNPLLANIVFPIAMKSGIKVRIIHAHSTKLTNTNGFKYIRNWLMIRGVSKFATNLWGCSKDACDVYFGNKKPYRILPNAINVTKFRFSASIRNYTRKSLGLEDKFVIGHIGRFSKEKNHKFLINIFQKIIKKIPNAHLLLVGDGPLREEISNMVKSYSLENDVTFLGRREDVNNILQGMDYYVLPSNFEGFSLSTLEAQASGLRCMISDHLPDEVIVIDDLCIKKSLLNTPEEWANEIIAKHNYERRDTSLQLRKAGYDLPSASKLLVKNYINLVYDSIK